MSHISGDVGRGRPRAAFPDAANETDWSAVIRVGLVAGLAGGATIWVGAQHLMPLAGIPRNATGLVFGKAEQDQLGPLAYLIRHGHPPRFLARLGSAVCDHRAALPQPRLRGDAGRPLLCRRSLDRNTRPDLDRLLEPPGLPRSELHHRRVHVHFFYAVPVALIVKRELAQSVR
jgi:hypothetical protein